MTLWIIEPRDPLIFGDGKPFSAVPGSRAKSLIFPHPSTIAGAMRTHSGTDPKGQFDSSRIDELLGKHLRGPVLVELAPDTNVQDWLLPVPADALVLKADDEKAGRRLWLRPLKMPDGAMTNLNSGLELVGASNKVEGKPHPKPPRYWNWKAYERWLLAPADDTADALTADWGHEGPAREYRMHVSIEPGSQTAQEGALFQTSGLEFTRVSGNGRSELHGTTRLALALNTDADLRAGLDFLGGEKRAVYWQQSTDELPVCPDEVRKAITMQKHCRLLLLTPGWFERGYLPTWVRTCTTDVTVEIVAAAVSRYQTVSGWDYAGTPQGPKLTRRLTPAGSVYFLRLNGDDDAIERFVEVVWMHNISDCSQDRRDGFGLAVVGVWDGKSADLNLEVNA